MNAPTPPGERRGRQVSIGVSLGHPRLESASPSTLRRRSDLARGL